MGTETVSEQNQQHTEIEEQAAVRHLNAVSQEQEQVKELLRRGAVRHYFLGPETIWSREGFGVVVGGALTIFFGSVIFPLLFSYTGGSAIMLIVCRIITILGVVVFGKGLYDMYKESRMESKPVPDRVHDEILEHDIAGLKTTSKEMLEKHVPDLEKRDSFDRMELRLIKGPRTYSGFVNLPLVWKTGEDGMLRYSNYSVMALYFGEEILYIYTCIFNMRNGQSKFHHTYECPYAQIRSAYFEDREIESVNQSNKAMVQHLKVLVVDAGDGENDKCAIPVTDFDAMKKYNGNIDIREAEEVIKLINEKIEGVNSN